MSTNQVHIFASDSRIRFYKILNYHWNSESVYLQAEANQLIYQWTEGFGPATSWGRRRQESTPQHSQSRAVSQQLAMTEILIYQHTAKPWKFREQITNEISSTRTSQWSALQVFTSKAPGQGNYIQYLWSLDTGQQVEVNDVSIPFTFA